MVQGVAVGKVSARVKLAVAGAVVVLAAVVGAIGLTERPEPPLQTTSGERGCQMVTALNAARGDRSAPVTTGMGTVVVLGDSYAQGVGLPDPRNQAWPAWYGRSTRTTVWVDAVGATGIVSGGYCGGQSFATRLPEVFTHHPNHVIVQSGLNDLYVKPNVLGAATSQLLAALTATPDVSVVGPTLPPRFDPARVRAADTTMAEATTRAGRRYVSALNWRLPWQHDQVHPTAVGHLEFAHLLVTAGG